MPVLSYDELCSVANWAKKFFSEEYYFRFEGTNGDPILVAMLPLENCNTAIERYHVKDIIVNNFRPSRF